MCLWEKTFRVLLVQKYERKKKKERKRKEKNIDHMTGQTGAKFTRCVALFLGKAEGELAKLVQSFNRSTLNE